MQDFYQEMKHIDRREELPDGAVICLLPNYYPRDKADQIQKYLKENIQWQEQEYYGRVCRRQAAWFADDNVKYRYTGQTLLGKGWDPIVDDIRLDLEQAAHAAFNSVLLHYYPDGKASMGWHADAEPELGLNPVIGSLSFGQTRTFKLRNEVTKQVQKYELEHGMLLIMAGTTQHHYKHCVPATTKALDERFNLTFRFTHPAQHVDKT